MNGTLYGVGVGPGDPELLTLKAVRVIEECSVIALPDSGGGEQMALAIAGAYLAGKERLTLSMPMTRDKEALAASHRAAADRLCQVLSRGKDVAFLTLGDPSVYSTYLYLHRLVGERGFEVRIIPGVPSFCAAASASGRGLCEGNQPLHILPAAYGDVEAALDLEGTKVLMKAGKKAGEAVEVLSRRGELGKAVLVERCGLPGERILTDLESYSGESGYFTTIIVKE